jgi:hypothetical protein
VKTVIRVILRSVKIVDPRNPRPVKTAIRVIRVP